MRPGGSQLALRWRLMFSFFHTNVQAAQKHSGPHRTDVCGMVDDAAVMLVTTAVEW